MIRSAILYLSIAALTLALSPTPASAQAVERVWEEGTVWSVDFIETKPAMFNAYIKDLSQVWRAFLEEQKQTGDVVSYKMLSVVSPRDGEPNLLLLVEFKNMAVLDRSEEYFEEMTAKIMGSLDNLQQANIERGEIRNLRGGLLTREIHFKE